MLYIKNNSLFLNNSEFKIKTSANDEWIDFFFRISEELIKKYKYKVKFTFDDFFIKLIIKNI